MNDSIARSIGLATTGRPFYVRVVALGYLLVALAGIVFGIFILPSGMWGEAAWILPIILVGLLFAGAVWRFGTWALVLTGVPAAIVALLTPLTNFFFMHPESASGFIPLVLIFTGSAMAALGAVVSIVQERRHTVRLTATRTESVVLRIVLGAVALLGIMSLGLTANARTTLPAETKVGTLIITELHFAYSPPYLVVRSGDSVRLVIRNWDATLHTFTIDEVGVDVSVPPGAERLVEFKAPAPGEYQWYCVPHSRLEGKTRIGVVGSMVVQ